MFKRIRKTLRTVRYLTLSHVIGKQILISSVENAASEVATNLQNEFSWLSSSRMIETAELTLPKYGLLDLTFNLTDQHKTNSLRVEDLKTLGAFPPKSDRLSTTDGYFLLPEFHEQICEEAENGNLHALFFLTSDTTDLIADEGKEPNVFAFGLSFPQIVTVKDACITNAESIWTLKHFYL